MKKDFEEHKNCTGSLNTGPDCNSSCDCFEYMVEDVKRDLMKNYNVIHTTGSDLAEGFHISLKDKYGSL